MMQPKVYFIGDEEIHMFGFYVGVVWSLKEHVVRVGNIQTTTWERSGPPAIAFPWIREDGDSAYVDEDNTISGGLTAEQADKVAQGLIAAAAYIRALPARRASN
jgi:hypothetical protein